jgi:hypothetical protein
MQVRGYRCEFPKQGAEFPYEAQLRKHPLSALTFLLAVHSGRARSKAWNVFTRSNTGILGSNPTQGMDVCVYSVCVVLYR